nr:EamA family transporter [Roseomonas mucosa]
MGTLCGLGAMLSWGFFVLNNKAGNVTGLSPSQENRLWVAWIGVGSFLGSAIILLPFLATGQSQIPDLFAVAQHNWRPIALAAFMGLFSTWAATWLWREGVRHLTPALTAQLAASETLFAVAYALFYERTVPSVGVATGAVLIMGGIMLTSAIPFMVGRLRSRRAVPTDD